MGREIKRVPLDFDWPLNKTWAGYTMPDKFHEDPCPDCDGGGWSPPAQTLFSQWYGNAPFDLTSTGSTPLAPETPAVRAFAERNVANAPEFYGTGECAIFTEGQRLADLWNRQWNHHLSQEDVDALLLAGNLRDLTHRWDPETREYVAIDPAPEITPAVVQEWGILSPFALTSSDAYSAIRARCEKGGYSDRCSTCDGHGGLEAYEGQRAEAEVWEQTEPPEGEGYQLWETVSEGSPITPGFANASGLAQYMTEHCWGSQTNRMASSFAAAMKFIEAGWAPSGVITTEHGVEDGVEWVARTAEVS
jgi:hypothetical protein